MHNELDLHLLAAQYVLEELLVDSLPEIGIRALELGYDTPTLRQLAGAQNYDSEEVHKLFNKSLEELKITLPKRDKAALILAKSIARHVIDGIENPYDGAQKIWAIESMFPQGIKQLLPFIADVSEYDNDPKHRDIYLSNIVNECKRLIEDNT